MKFKLIFVLFNITLLFLLAVLVFFSLGIMGTSFYETFWRINLPFILVFILLFSGFNIFYFLNRRLFSLLEMENWPSLIRYLEDKIIKKGRYSSRLVRLLAHCYLILSDSSAVMSLENKVAIAKPALIDTHALLFGTARILARDFSGAVRFFEARIAAASAKAGTAARKKDWLCFYYGFALFLNKRYKEGSKEFSILAQESKDGIITALSSYFLKESSRSFQAEYQVSLQGKERVKKILADKKDWNRELDRLSSEIHVAAIAKKLDETARWVYNY